ncbi:MAG: lantibiotic dehydratase [Taibaiella sp.]|jgi:thiopeptide-type bacteriocin biosynthesis protein
MLKTFSYLLFRSPLQPFNGASKYSSNTKAIFQEGLYLSSPEFWQEFQKREQLNGKEKEKLELSFAKYWLRSSVRCTPYGTFAGSAMATISDQDSALILGSNDSHRRSLRLDMNYMAEIVNALVQMPVIREQMLFFTNNSLYPTANAYRYAEYYIHNNTRNYQLTSVDWSLYLQEILSNAKCGATIKELVVTLMREESVPEEEALSYITELWLSQLLIPSLEPAVTGAEPLGQVIGQLEQLQGADEILNKLKEIQQLLNHPQEGVDYYKRIEAKLKELELGIEVPKNTVQADLFLNTINAHVNKDLVATIINQVEDLKALARQNSNPELEDFKTRFYARYEEKMMPLAIVLDADLGIGYAGVSDQSAGAGEWVDGLAVMGGTGANAGSNMDYLQQFSLSKYKDWLASSKAFIEISEEEIKTFREQTKSFKFPVSMYVMGNLMKQDGQLSKEHFQFDLTGLGGPSAANLLGRFTHGDEQLCQLTKEILEQEELEKPDAIYAEIAHLPQARIGNILLRPVLRKYEIPYVGLSGIRKEKQINIDDLYVSVQNNEIRLFSKRLNKRIIPRLTTAHNFGYNSLPIYKFLCDLQGQSIAYPNVWNWGHLSTLKHLPRVVYKKLILQKAIWKIEEKEIADLPEDKEQYSDYFQVFRSQLKIPQRVVYKEGDNELLIDFIQEKGIQLFLHYLKRYKNITLEEFLFTEDNCVVYDEQGNPFTNEMIIPVYEEAKVTEPVFVKENYLFDKLDGQPQRSFSPYSEWLYFKVYCGARSAEKILTTVVLPFIEEGLEQELFEQFFYIRYKDESGGHFRIRFYNSALEKQLHLYQRFMKVLQFLVDNGTIEKVMLDTYNRELERYTPALIRHAETLFYHDSLAVLRFTNLLDGIDGEQYRMLFALRGIDLLLSDFEFSLEQKGTLAKKLQRNFFNEFGGQPVLQKQLNERYRKHQQFFVSHLNPEKDTEHEIEEAAAIFNIRSEMNKPVVEEIQNHLNKTEQTNKISDLLSSYIHMFMNRMYVAQQRKYELVVYHFLERYYTSRIAIAKKQKNAIPHYK